MAIQFQDNSDAVLDLLQQALERACEDIGEKATEYAAARTPVDTGRARNSITYATHKRQGIAQEYKDDKNKTFVDQIGQGVQEGEVYIGTNVDYFQYIENGSRTIDAFHPLQHAATEHGDEYQEILRQHMLNA